MSCNAEAYVLPVSLSRGALIAILACIFVLLGKALSASWEDELFCPGQGVANLLKMKDTNARAHKGPKHGTGVVGPLLLQTGV